MPSIHVMKQKIQEAVDARDEQLRAIALAIHAHPELAFHEHQAVSWLTEPLREAGFTVEIGVGGLATAFRATWDGAVDGPTVALLAEYDALPGLGHACGHNLIGTASVGAALALKDTIEHLPGRLWVIGTPAEEGGGGKIHLADAGVFDGVDAAMMCHPSGRTMTTRGGLARVAVRFKFFGKAAHASSAPEKGISALEAMLQFFNGVNALRQFLPDGVRVHGIITRGGDAPNIVPEYCEADFLIRAHHLAELEQVAAKVYDAARFAAQSVGARCEIEERSVYPERNVNFALAALFQDNLESMGIPVSPPPERGGLGSSDIGRVSHMTPTIHPYIKICDENITAHTIAFREAAASEAGLVGMNQAAKALAMTAADLFFRPDAFQQVTAEFQRWKEHSVQERMV